MKNDDEKGIRATGALSQCELCECAGVPDEERLQLGPVVVIECNEEIPCNPCEASCPQGAIYVGKTLTNRPCVDFDRCIGCRLCVARCPGLAIFVVDLSLEDGDRVSLPFEFLPLPTPKDTVDCLNRCGDFVCEGEVLRVDRPRGDGETAVVTLRVPKGNGMVVRFFRPKKRGRSENGV